MYEDCPSNWAYQYLEGNKSESGIFAEIGTAAHSIVESYLKKEIDHPLNHPDLSVIPAKEKESVVQYALSREGKRERLIGTEIEFIIEVLPGIKVKGFIDSVYDHTDGTIEIEDHKTNRSRETADEWAAKIQMRLYSLVARNFLWPNSKRIQFTVGYVMIGGDVTWQTDPAWDEETLKRIENAWTGMHGGNYPEKLGSHCRYCPKSSTCTTYNREMKNMKESLMFPSVEETPIEKYVRLKEIKTLLEHELESIEEKVISQIKDTGPIEFGGKKWGIKKTSKRKAPDFISFWSAAMGPDGFDQDAQQAIFELGPEILTVKLGGIDKICSSHQEMKNRIQKTISRTEEESLFGESLEKIVKKPKK